jgi:hypothetical protein
MRNVKDDNLLKERGNQDRAQSRQSAKPFLKSSELGLPQLFTRRRVFPPVLGEGAHSLAREGLGEYQFRRGGLF